MGNSLQVHGQVICRLDFRYIVYRKYCLCTIAEIIKIILRTDEFVYNEPKKIMRDIVTIDSMPGTHEGVPGTHEGVPGAGDFLVGCRVLEFTPGAPPAPHVPVAPGARASFC